MPTRSRPAPLSPTRRAAVSAALGAVLVLAAACGASTGAEVPAAASDTATDSATDTATDTPTAVPAVTAAATAAPTAQPPVAPAARPTPAPAVATGLPWPAATAAGAVDLQKTVDNGAQPWLLDPTDVANSYAQFRGWKDLQVSGGDGGTPTHVTVRTAGSTHDLTLAQPIRKGEGGIWLVQADTPG